MSEPITLKTPYDIGQLIRRRRREIGIKTLDQFSLMTGHSKRFLSELENGKPGASIGAVMNILAELGIELAVTER